jgi:hypothetical protein
MAHFFQHLNHNGTHGMNGKRIYLVSMMMNGMVFITRTFVFFSYSATCSIFGHTFQSDLTQRTRVMKIQSFHKNGFSLKKLLGFFVTLFFG